MEEKREFGKITAKKLEEERNKFLNDIVFFFVSCGTPNNPADNEELKTYRNFVPILVGFGVEEYNEKMRELNYEKDKKDEISEFERKLDQLYDKYIRKGKDDTSVPPGMVVPGGVTITLVVRDGKEYRVMKLS